MKKRKMGIQTKVLGILIPVIFVAIAALLSLIYVSTSRIVTQKSETNLIVSTESVIHTVTAWMNTTLTALETERDTIEYFNMDPASELDYIKHTANIYDSFPAGIYLATTEGQLIHASFVPGPEFDVFKKPWYIDGIKSEDFILGDVYYDEDSKNYVVGASGILRDKDQNIRGVAAADIYLNAISDIVRQVQLEETGGALLIDSRTNTIIGHRDESLVGTILTEQTDNFYHSISELITSGSTGLQTYQGSDRNKTYLNIQPVPNSDWIAISYVPQAEVLSDINLLARNIIAMAVGAVLLLTLMIVLLIRKLVVVPVKKLDYVAGQIAEGELNARIDYHSNDEFGKLAEEFNKTVARLSSYIDYINEISRVLNDIADGNLDFKLTFDYVGEFSRIKDALNHISLSLNDTIKQINQTADQVASGSEDVSSGAQSLSQGTTEQASSIEELAATINEISDQVRDNAKNAEQANSQANSVGEEMAESKQQMILMVNAMKDIRNSSNEIKKIIKTIEDIAFQTNILALNAAVEAARAGEAGKGFAVVADEVRDLATKSSEASKNTAELIEHSLSAIENGAQIADSTANSLLQAVDAVKAVTDTISNISSASANQSQSITQVTQGIDQISSVVQTISATAEESAAASVELSGQSKTLKQLTERFHLKSSDE